MRVATYTRISTDEDHQPYSLEAQAERIGAYVKSQDGWELTRRFSDQASGASTERPGLKRALAEARAGRFDLLLVYRVDRFSRSVRGLAQLLEDLDAAGVAFRSATEPFDTTTPAGRMMVPMLGVFAEFERATIVDRVIAGMERKPARGAWCGGSRPFGYDVDPATGYLAPKADEAPLVPVMFDRYVHGREGARALAVWLNESGHRTKAGRPWSHTAVLTVLRNPVYVGKVFFREALHDGPHEHLVDEKLFERVQALLSERGEDCSKRASATSPFLLAGLVVCTRCGKHYVGTSAVWAIAISTATTRASPASATARSTAMPSACRPRSWTRPSSTRCSTFTSEPISSTRPSRRPDTGRSPSRGTTTRNSPSSTPASPRPRTPSSAIYRHSRQARCRRLSAASASSSSPRR
jgi:site-specific DNA recombinase